MDDRTEELAQRLAAVKERIAAAEQERRVEADPVELIVVTKFFPAGDVSRLLDLGLRQIGENRDQEASCKAQEVKGATWHFIGQLQSKKTNSVVRYASYVHSVDRQSLVIALGKSVRHHREAVASGVIEPGPNNRRDLQCFLQVSLDGSVGRGGVAPEALEDLAHCVESEDGLALKGVMAVAPLGVSPDAAFERLYEYSQVVRGVNPSACCISSGMSGDLETAIRWGSTHVRVGSGILGARQVG